MSKKLDISNIKTLRLEDEEPRKVIAIDPDGGIWLEADEVDYGDPNFPVGPYVGEPGKEQDDGR